MFGRIIISTALFVSMCEAATLPVFIDQPAMSRLVDHVQSIADKIASRQAPRSSTALKVIDQEPTTEVAPGHMEVCDMLCPKWCQKTAISAGKSAHCHYVCSNLCNTKMAQMNPFIGNKRYEVVASEFEFEHYDTNKDKRITIEEFTRAEGIPSAEANDFFIFADLNGDGFVDTDEFKGGPLVFTVQMASELSQMAMAAQTPTTPALPQLQSSNLEIKLNLKLSKQLSTN